MYRPPAFRAGDAEALGLIAQHPLAQLVAVADGRPIATPVPLIMRGDALVGHLARPNPVWRHPGPALAIFSGADSYVSPRWYADKAVNGKVVPTWNYLTVQVAGRLVVHDDPVWTHRLVSDLTDHFEASSDDPWAVTDAPDEYVGSMVRGIVGIELVELELVGKLKLSQNRTEDDRRRVAAGLSTGSPAEQAIADAVAGSLRE
jgi:transcriptional regulator